MTLVDEVANLLDGLAPALDPVQRAATVGATNRLRDPTLRIAIAGRIKAGKSTLLNALVGEAVAPTDAAECTKVVTRYTNGPAYRVSLFPKDTPGPVAVGFERRGGKATIDLGGHSPEAVDHLHVEFPSTRLDNLEIIDTPGLASVSEDVSAKTETFLLEANSTSGVDVVLYLLRHVHERDIDFLEAFSADDRPANPAMAIGVLSRADEIGGGRSDAMELARSIARRYRNEPRLRRHVQSVVAVSGLLSYTSATMRQEDVEILRSLAAGPVDVVDHVLLSADGFLRDARLTGLPTERRQALLDRFGIFGLRWGVAVLRQTPGLSAGGLADRLTELSGIEPLRRVIEQQFAGRQAVLKADLALTLALRASWTMERAAGRRVRSEVERIRLNAPEIRELDALNRLRVEPPADLTPKELQEAERLLGGAGTSPADRLGVAEIADPERFRIQVSTRIDEWNARENDRSASRELRELAAVIAGSLSALFMEIGG